MFVSQFIIQVMSCVFSFLCTFGAGSVGGSQQGLQKVNPHVNPLELIQGVKCTTRSVMKFVPCTIKLCVSWKGRRAFKDCSEDQHFSHCVVFACYRIHSTVLRSAD
jgi:hypothetical protein